MDHWRSLLKRPQVQKPRVSHVVPLYLPDVAGFPGAGQRNAEALFPILVGDRDPLSDPKLFRRQALFRLLHDPPAHSIESGR